MSRSLRDPALLIRHGLSAVGPSLVLAVLAFVTVGAVALAPRLVDAASTSELRYDIARLDPTQRDVQTSNNVSLMPPASATGELGSVSQMYADLDTALARAKSQALPGLQALLGAPDYMARTSHPSSAASDDAAKNGPGYHIDFAADPKWSSRVTMVAGAPPVAGGPSGDVTSIWLSQTSARQLNWDVGEERTAVLAPTNAGDPPSFSRVVLAGIFVPADTQAPYWQHVPGVLTPRAVDNGNDPIQYFAVAYLAPDRWAAPGYPVQAMTLTAWFPLDSSTLDVASSTALLPQLRAFTAGSYPIVEAMPPFPVQQSSFASGTLTALDTALSRIGAMDAVLAVIAAAPLGVVLAVFALAVGAVIERRRAALSLAAARGASAAQTRGAMALEGVVAATVPGVVAAVVVALLFPTSTWLSLVPALGVSLVPVVMFAAAPGARGLRARRADLGAKTRGVVRLVAELAIVALAITATVLLLVRGERSTNVFDPLLLATPLLIALAVCALLLRIFPLPMRALEAAFHRSRGLVGFVGAARAIRDPALGAVGTVTIVLAVAVAVFSAGLLTTVDTAARASAHLQTGGGDAIAVSASFSDAQRQAMAAVPGVTATAGVLDQGRVAITGWNGSGATDLVQADLTALATMRPDIPASGLDHKQGDAIPVIASESFATAVTGPMSLNGAPLVIVGTLPDEPGLNIHSRQWVMVDSSLASVLTANGFVPDTVVFSLSSADPATLAAIKTAGSAAAVRDFAGQIADELGSPAVSGLRDLLIAAAIGVGALAALAIILASLLAGPGRERVVGALRTLGATRGIVGRLVVWELAPSVLAALIAGAVLGIGLPFIVVAGVDLAPFTGGLAVTLPREDPVVILAVLAVVLVVAALASAIAAAVTLRRSPAATISIGAD